MSCARRSHSTVSIVPCFELGDGCPRVAVIGGVHGCEYSSIAAVTRLMRELEADELNGTVIGVPVVSMQSFTERSPFVIPEDGKNLNRAFPGDPDGTYTRAARARHLHAADRAGRRAAGPARRRPGRGAGAVRDLLGSREPDLALAFGLPYVVIERRQPERDDVRVGEAGRDRRGGRDRAARGVRGRPAGQRREERAQAPRRARRRAGADALDGRARFEWLYSTPAASGSQTSRPATRSARTTWSARSATSTATCSRRSGARRRRRAVPHDERRGRAERPADGPRLRLARPRAAAGRRPAAPAARPGRRTPAGRAIQARPKPGTVIASAVVIQTRPRSPTRKLWTIGSPSNCPARSVSGTSRVTSNSTRRSLAATRAHGSTRAAGTTPRTA